MVYYYSATGNSAYAATEVARLLGERNQPVSMPRALMSERLDVYSGEYIGFVFPIYSWGVPPIVLDFVERLPEELFKDKYIWALCTCGDEAGNAMKHFAKAIKRVCGRTPDLSVSIIMPNTYVLLPGFTVDAEDVSDAKLHEAPHRLRRIAEIIKAKELNRTEVHTGSIPALRSLAYPFFKRWGINTKKWHSNSDCIHCGLCAKICPVGNISYNEEGRPVWSSRCLSCCACFHVCPKRAIDYGKITEGKGQYMFPGYPKTWIE